MPTTMTKLLRAAAVLACALLPVAASAQTSPNLRQGQVLTPAQWNQLFINKQDTLGYSPVNKAGDIMVGRLVTAPPSATTAGLNLTCGTAPASPVDGDQWCTTSGLFVRINGSTVGPLIGAGASTFTGTSPIVASFPSPGVVNYALDLTVANTFQATQTVQGASTTQPAWNVSISGDTTSRARFGINATDVASLSFGSGSSLRDVFLERLGPASIRHGAPDAASAVAQTIGVQNVVAGTSNTAGAALTLQGSRGTGTGAGGNIAFQVAPSGSTGTSQNALTTALTIFGADAGVMLGSPAGSDKGASTLNAAGLIYVNGNAVADAATAPLVLGATTGVLTCPTCVTGTGGALTVGVTPTSGLTSGQVLRSDGSLLQAYPVSGTGNVAMTTSPAFTTPSLGAATATSVNGLSITTSTGTLTVANAKTLTDTSGVGASILLGAAGGGFSGYGGATCTNQALTVLSAAGVGTCSSITNSFLTAGSFASITGVGTLGSLAVTGAITSADHTITSSSAAAFSVGLNGATNPAFVVDDSTASQASGVKVTGAVTGGTVAIAARDSGANTNLSINAKGTGTIAVGNVSTGGVTITPALTLGTALSIANGGTGQITNTAAFDALAPSPTRAGDIAYWNGTHWVTVAGNNSGTLFLQETASGVPSWTTPGGGGNVSNSGTPTNGQMAQWTSATVVQGVNVASVLTAGIGISITGTTNATISGDSTAWTTYTPTMTGGCTTWGANGVSYKQIGAKTYLFSVNLVLSNATGCAGQFTFSLPGGVSAATDVSAVLRENVNTGTVYFGWVMGTLTAMTVGTATNGNPAYANSNRYGGTFVLQAQ